MKIYKALAKKNKGAVKASAQLVRDDNYGLEFKDDDGATLRVVEDNGEYYIRRIYNDGTGFAWDKSRERFSSPEEAKRAILDGDATFRLKASRSIKASRRQSKITAARDITLLTFNELTPEQQQYVIDNCDELRPVANAVSEWFNTDIMEQYHYEVEELAKRYSDEYGLTIHYEKLYWQENSQGPYPEWSLDQVFDTYYEDLEPGVEVSIEFDGKYTSVRAYVEINAYDSDEYESDNVYLNDVYTESLDLVDLPESDKDEIMRIVTGAQKFIDEVWQLIRDTCWETPDDDWIRDMLANNEVFDFYVNEDGTVDVVR